jgi:PD-(D/E)XK nuclease superfamily
VSAPFGPIVIRCSSLSGYPDCPRRGAARLFWREIEAAGFKLRRTMRGIGAAIGTALHKAAATTLDEKARSGELPPVNVATDIAVAELAEQARHEIEFDGPNGPTHSRREAELQILAMTRMYHYLIAPDIEPLAVEQRFEAEVEPGIILSGQPDVVAREPHRVRDLKSGARRPGSVQPQVGGYALLARSHGLDIDSAAIDFIQRVPINKPQPEPVSNPVALAPAETAASSIIKHIAGDLSTFRYGDPERRILPGDSWSFPANPNSMLCGEKWCPCWGVTGPHAFCNEWQPK